MSIEITWADKYERLLVWHFVGAWTLDEFRAATRQTQAMADQFDHRFALIFDVLRGKTPRFPLAEIQRSIKVPAVKRDFLIIVTKDLFIRSLLAVLPRLGMPNMGANQIAVVGSMADAYTQIRQRLGAHDPDYLDALNSLATYDDALG